MPPKESAALSPAAAASPSIATLFSASSPASAMAAGPSSLRKAVSYATPGSAGPSAPAHPSPFQQSQAQQPSLALTPASAAAATPFRALNHAAVRNGDFSPQVSRQPSQTNPQAHVQRRAAAIKTIDDDVSDFEAALDELQKLGSRFYDELEGQLGPQGNSRAVHDALCQLLDHLSAMMAKLSRSTVGGTAICDIVEDGKAAMADAATAERIEDRIAELCSESNDSYERRQRLREAGGAVAHVLAAGEAGSRSVQQSIR